jgi:hypothetical protein
VAAQRETGGKIDGRGGFADAALLVRDGDDTACVCHMTNKAFI